MALRADRYIAGVDRKGIPIDPLTLASGFQIDFGKREIPQGSLRQAMQIATPKKRKTCGQFVPRH